MIDSKYTDLKYEYYLFTWGGFYNPEYKEIHKEEPGGKWFTSQVTRDDYINKIKKLSIDLNARYLMIDTSEGFNTRTNTKLHRVIEYNNNLMYSEYDLGVCYPFDAALYHLEWKWTPGHNNYPLGEKFDYTKINILQEWITGAFDKEQSKW